MKLWDELEQQAAVQHANRVSALVVLTLLSLSCILIAWVQGW